MRNKIIAVLMLFLLMFQMPCLAFFEDKSSCCVNNTAQKLDYINLCWWDRFNDPILKEYIVKAVECNHDLKKASWQVEEYKQFVKISFSQELPWLSTGANYILAKAPRIGGNTFQRSIFSVPFFVNYEADFFLKNRDKTKSSKKELEAAIYEEKALYISMASNVATTYLNVIKYDKLIDLQRNSLCLKEEILKRKNRMFDRGVISAIELNDAKKDYETAKSVLDDLIKYRDKSLNQLAVLIGESPCNSCCLDRASFDDFEYGCLIPDSISSDVVFARPDVMQAEKMLAKSKIDVRVARKEFLPRFNLTGIYNFNTISGNFFGWRSTLAYLFLGATQDLFKGGYKFANLRIYKSRFEQLFEAYKQVDLTALQEVNDSLLFIKQDTKIEKTSIEKLKMQEDSFKRQQKQYKNGVISCPELLDYEDLLLSYKKDCVDTKTNRLIDYFTLYKAVGGQL